MSKNTDSPKGLTLSFLVMPHEDGYLALCRETGIIRSGATLEAARARLESATKTLLEAVARDHTLAPSLHVGLPFRYRALFVWTVLKISSYRAMRNVLFVRQNTLDLGFRFA